MNYYVWYDGDKYEDFDYFEDAWDFSVEVCGIVFTTDGYQLTEIISGEVYETNIDSVC